MTTTNFSRYGETRNSVTAIGVIIYRCDTPWHDACGVAQRIVGSSASVTEPRAGTNANFQWRATPYVVFQGEVGIEVYETRTARTSSGRRRDLSGRLAVSVSLHKRTSLIIETGHDVEQMSFSQFLASSSLPTSTVTEGAIVAQNTAPQTLDTLSGRLALPLEGIGFASALLNVSVSLGDSSTIDPVTGDVRPISAWSNPSGQ